MSNASETRYVYLLQSNKRHIFKIGYTKNLEQRMQMLNSEHKNKLAPFTMRAYIVADNFADLETYLHERYEQYRLFREFFHFDDDVLSNVLADFVVIDYAYKNPDVIHDIFVHPYAVNEVRKTRLAMLKNAQKYENFLNGRPVITVEEAVELTNILPHTIYRYLRGGHWDSTQIGSTYLIYLDQELKPPRRKK